MTPDCNTPGAAYSEREPIHVSYLDNPWRVAERLSKWDRRYLDRAKEQTKWSKDTNTQVCAIIVDARHHAVSDGFNGFPHGLLDEEHRIKDKKFKLDHTIHAEMNALLFSRCDVSGMTLYVWPYAPCVRCAVHIIQAGISRIVAPMPLYYSSWAKSQIAGIDAFREVGIKLDYFACDELHDRPKDTVDWP